MIIGLPFKHNDQMDALAAGFATARVGDELHVRGSETELRRHFPQAFTETPLLARCHARLSAICQPEDAESHALIADLQRALGY